MQLKENRVCGVDESGRGPIAGPVVAAAVILPEKFYHPQIQDSKTLTAKQRNKAYDIIKKNAIAIGVGKIGPKKIDKINIRIATFEAMKHAVGNLRLPPDVLLVDGFKIPELDIIQYGIIGGDAKEQTIAAASIVAKVVRDRIMDDFHIEYPEYGFNTNRGYATKYHIGALYKVGPSSIHRFSFHPVCDVIKKKRENRRRPCSRFFK